MGQDQWDLNNKVALLVRHISYTVAEIIYPRVTLIVRWLYYPGTLKQYLNNIVVKKIRYKSIRYFLGIYNHWTRTDPLGSELSRLVQTFTNFGIVNGQDIFCVTLFLAHASRLIGSHCYIHIWQVPKNQKVLVSQECYIYCTL